MAAKMNGRDTRNLLRILESQLALAQEMRGVLLAERKAIVEGDVEGLLAAVSRKLDLVARMKDADKRRLDWLQSAGFEKASLASVTGGIPGGGAILEVGMILRKELEGLQTLSRSNSQMIRERLRATRGTLDFLVQLVSLGFQYGHEGRLATSPTPGGQLIDRQV